MFVIPFKSASQVTNPYDLSEFGELNNFEAKWLLFQLSFPVISVIRRWSNEENFKVEQATSDQIIFLKSTAISICISLVLNFFPLIASELYSS